MNQPAVASSLAVIALGGVLLADALGGLTLTFGNFAPIALAAVGAMLVSSGLGR